MEEKKFVAFKKEELGVKEYIKSSLGKGRISQVSIEYTPVGEKILVHTSRPGLIIGKRGEKIAELTSVLKRRFSLDNPHIEIVEITQPLFDAQLIADEIAILLEKKGSLKFKVIAYKMLQEIMKAGALGTEIVLSGKLPSDRARRWRFAQGYLKKTGDPAKLVSRAQSQATTIAGVVGVQVSILRPDTELNDQIIITEEIKQRLKSNVLQFELEESQEKNIKKPKAKKLDGEKNDNPKV
ncbi:MAG: 30S ribosomal protein S3 [Nanoarchaeota archaeon]